MKIAILTEGVSEFKSLPILYSQIHAQINALVMKPLKISTSPDAPTNAIVRECQSKILMAERSGANRVVLILDREQQQGCPGIIAESIEAAINKTSALPVSVVLKNRTYENWLIADVDGLKTLKGRFNIDRSFVSKVKPDKADSVDGYVLLNRASRRGEYDKVPDGEKIAKTMNVSRAAANSRSFRHFLHVLGYGAYREGCRLPRVD